MRNLLAIVGLVAVAILAVVLYSSYSGSGAVRAGGSPAMLAGAPAASFAVKRLDGTSGALADYRGKVVLLNLWATWCPPCREEMPDLERLYTQYRNQGLVVVGVDQGESANVAGDFAKAHGVTFPVLLDEDQQYGRAYAAVGLPTTVIVDRTGKIVRGIDGALSLAQMRDAVKPLL